MENLETLSIISLAVWCISEITISLLSLGNRSRISSTGVDRYSYFIVWFSTVFPVFLAYLIQKHPLLANGFGSLAPLFPFLGYAGCLVLLLGVTVRLAVLVVLPLGGILYRIHVKERVLLRHFGPAYQEYAGRTKSLLPGIW